MCIRPLILKYLPGVFPATVNSRNNTNRSWGQKVSSRIRQSRNFGGGIELSGEEEVAQSQHTMGTRQITVTTESSVSYEMKGGSCATKTSQDMDDNENDNETMSSEGRLTKR